MFSFSCAKKLLYLESEEIQLNQKAAEKEESETNLRAKIRDKSEVIVKL